MELALFYLQSIVKDILPLLPAAVLLCLASILITKVKGYQLSIRHGVGVGLFALFLIGLFSVTISFRSIWHDLINGSLQLRGEIDLIPFDGISKILNSDSDDYILVNIFGNIALFLPVGFCLPLLWRRFDTAPPTIAVGFLLSCFIEVMQLFTFRATDIDDVFLNTLGTAFGFLFVSFLRWLLPRFTRNFRLHKAKKRRGK